MTLRPLGRTGLSISPLVFGGNVFGWTADEATSFALLDAWVDAGFNAIDTADVYSRWAPGHEGGESEVIIGRWLKARPGLRERVVLITKVGSDLGGDRKGLSARWISQAVEDSLSRLQTDRIDVYLTHWPDPSVPYVETLGALGALKSAGKIRALGASNLDAAQLQASFEAARAAGLPRYDVLQPIYNLIDRAAYEGPLQALCVQEEVGVIPYQPLAAGFLTGKYRTEADLGKSVRGGGIGKRYLNDRGLRVLASLDAVAAELKTTPAEVAVAWVLAQPGVTAPIVSATSAAQLASLIKAARLNLGAARFTD